MKHERYRRFSRFTVSAVTGRSRVGVTIFVYSVFAALLLVYVSAQIYAGVLRQEIAALEQQKLDSRETFNKLTGRYVALSSRARVSEYCETKLAMERIGGGNLEVLAVGDDLEAVSPAMLAEKPRALPSPQRYTSRRSDRNVGQ
jgi:cell division protein FtsL